MDYQSLLQPNPLYTFPDQLWTNRRMVGPEELPHLVSTKNISYYRNLIKEKGLRSQFIQSMVFGRFAFSSAENNIFMERHVDLMRDAMTGNSKPLPGDIRAAGDVSGGGDKQVLMVREGTEVLMIDLHRSDTEIEMAEYWVETLNHLGVAPHQFTIDGGGIGAPVANYMELRLGYAGINRFMANNAPTLDFEYADYYTEIHYWVKELLAYGVLKLPFNEALLEQMRNRLYVSSNAVGRENRIKTEPKKAYRERHGGKSPDEMDALVYLFSDFNMDAVRRGLAGEAKKRVSIYQNEAEPSAWELEATTAQPGGGSFSCLRPQDQFVFRR